MVRIARMGKPKKRKRQWMAPSDTLREHIKNGPSTCYQLTKELGIPKGRLSEFVNGHGGVTLARFDELCRHLGFELRKVE